MHILDNFLINRPGFFESESAKLFSITVGLQYYFFYVVNLSIVRSRLCFFLYFSLRESVCIHLSVTMLLSFPTEKKNIFYNKNKKIKPPTPRKNKYIKIGVNMKISFTAIVKEIIGQYIPSIKKYFLTK